MRFASFLTLAVGFIFIIPVTAADSNQQKVDQMFAAHDKTGFPGCALGVMQDGNFIYRKGYGREASNSGFHFHRSPFSM
jgi:hypothetical protein